MPAGSRSCPIVEHGPAASAALCVRCPREPPETAVSSASRAAHRPSGDRTEPGRAAVFRRGRLDLHAGPEDKRRVTLRQAVWVIAATLTATTTATIGTACSRRAGAADGASCRDVGAQLFAVARKQLADSKAGDPAVRHRIEGLLAPIRDTMVRACEDGGWSLAARACFAAAADQAAMLTCHQALTETQRERLVQSAAGGKTSD